MSGSAKRPNVTPHTQSPLLHYTLAPASDLGRTGGGLGRYVGRVGALAVALGVGVAVATGQGIGIARADDTSSSASSSDSSASTTDDTAPADTPADIPTTTTGSTGSTSPGTATGPSVPTMNVGLSGGATLSGGGSESTKDSDDEDPDDEAEKPTKDEKPGTSDETTPPAVTPTHPTAEPKSDSSAPEPPSRPTRVEPTAQPVVVRSDSHATEPESVATPPVARALAVTATTTVTTTAIAPVAPAAPSAPALRPQDPISALISLPGAIIAAVLKPFLAPGPAGPMQPPLLLEALSLVAREIQRILFNATPVARNQQVDLTLQNPDDVSGPIVFDAADTDGDPLVYSVPTRGTVGGPSHGTVTIDQATGSFVYNPDDAFAATGGTDTFTVTVTDAAGAPHIHGLLGLLSWGAYGHTSTATVTINLAAVNVAPVAVDDAVTTNEDTPVTGSLIANDSGRESAVLTTTLLTGPAHGTAVVSATGVFTYTPAQDFNGTDSFTYTLSDGQLTATATVTVTVVPVNDAVVAVADTASTDEDTPVTVDVLANDRAENPDGPGESLAVTLSTAPNHGTAVVNVDGSITYAPAPKFFGVDTFTYAVTDGTTFATGTVTIAVTSVNDPVVAISDTATTAEDTPVTGNVLTNDRAQNIDGPDEVLTVVSGTFTSTNGGTLVLGADGGYTYTPGADFNGVDTFTYTVADATTTATGTLTITVTPVDDPITAVDDAVTIDEGSGTLTGNVLTNDRAQNPDGPDETLTVRPFRQGSVRTGWVDMSSDGSYSYTPGGNFNGTMTVQYTVDDVAGNTATGTLTITVRPVDDPITARPDTATTDEDTPVSGNVLTNDRAQNVDGAGETLTATLNTGPVHGTVVVNADGTFTYTPTANFHGTDSFTYTVADTASTATGTVTITVRPVDDPVVAVDDTATTDEDTPVTGNVLTNDIAENVDGPTEPLTAVSATYTSAHGGTLVIGANGAYTYTPAPNFHGVDTFTYTVADATSTAIGILTITVNSVDDPITAGNQSITVDEDATPVTGNLLTTVRAQNPDGPGEELTISNPGVTFDPSVGALTVLANGDYTFVPAPNQSGTISYTYVVTDGTHQSSGTLVITVRAVNDPVTAIPDTATTYEDSGTITGNVLTNDRAQNPDGPSEILTIVNPGTVTNTLGTLVVAADGTYSFTPAANANGTFSQAYTVTDGAHQSVSTLTVVVRAVNDPITAIPDTVTTYEDSGTITGNVLTNDRAQNPDGPGEILSTIPNVIVTPGFGNVGITGNGTYTYTPAANANGTFTVNYIVTDGVHSSIGTLTITVTPVDDAITAADDAITVDEDSATTTGDLLTNDRAQNPDGPSEILTIVNPGTVTNTLGTLVVAADGTYSFTPAANANGTFSQAYTVTDGAHQSVSTLTVVVRAVNDPITAIPDTVTTYEDSGTITGNVLTNDRAQNPDGPGEILSTIPNVIVTPGFGNVGITGNGTYTYTPAANANGTFTVNYIVTDGVHSSIGTLTITITPVNDAPTAPVISPSTLTPNPYTGVVSGLASSTDVDGDVLTWSATTPAGGQVVINPNGTFTYTPTQRARENRPGTTDSFTITVSDGTATASTAVTVTIAPVNVVLGSTAVDAQPNGVAVTPNGNRAFVANQSAGTVSVVDVATNTVVKTIVVQPTPTAIALNPNGTRAYVTSQSGAVTVIDTDTNEIVKVIGTAPSPLGIAVSPNGDRVYVAHFQSGGVTVIRTSDNTIVNTFGSVGAVRGVAVSGDGTRIYVTTFSTGQLITLNATTGGVLGTVNGLGTNANRIALSPDGTRAYVSNNTASGTVAVVNLQDGTIMRTITVASSPNVIALSPDGTRLYVTGANNYVTVIDTGTFDQAATIDVGGSSRGVAVSADGTRLYVTSNSASAPGKLTVIAIGNLGANPIGL